MTQINRLPLFYKFNSNRDNGGLPDTFPFQLYFDEDLNMLRQKDSADLSEILEKIYIEGSLVEGSTSSESGKVYVENFTGFIKSQCTGLKQAKVLEIGCGKGDIIKAIKDEVKSIIGLEPGNHGLIDGLKEVEIIKGFFPSEKISGTFDLIYHFGVLEHIADPMDFLLRQKRQLTGNGIIILGVPNCEPYYKTGDVSMFIHEHYNYFTIAALSRLANKVNMQMMDVIISEGMLFCCLGLNAGDSRKIADSENYFDSFISVNDRFFNKLKQCLTSIAMGKIAIYVPGRALNILYLLGLQQVRLIDDSSEVHGKYLPYLQNPIENFDDLVLNPPEIVIIFSRTFGEKILNKLKSRPEMKNTTIIEINEID